MRVAPKRLTLAAPPADPFGERRGGRYSERVQLLGAQFNFETDSPHLLRIVRLAYARLPSHRFCGAVPRLQVRLMLTARERPGRAPVAASEP
ncbi:MAG TPA: hypothetical protein VKB20_00705, partial [Steroidobacteraceae bacterium]|nr:hypothetical protein [Steroidobacteraceae bacterium]